MLKEKEVTRKVVLVVLVPKNNLLKIICDLLEVVGCCLHMASKCISR